MRATHWAINYSDACDAGGSGICDGEVPDGEGNVNAVSSECTCKCHTVEDLPQTYAGVKVWHDAWHLLPVSQDTALSVDGIKWPTA